MSQPIIEVQETSKKFCRSIKRAMLYGTTDMARDFFGIAHRRDFRKHEFWAVRDISLTLERGGSLAIIGGNGSGKSTVLKMLNGVLLPDRGRIVVRGRTGALIEVGAGFHPALTGRENVLINGMILGMTEREVAQRFDSIVDFAELDEFIDMPTKNYSSGMYVRLGFAVAIHAPVELLLVDEVLAVGDLAFSLKCLRRIAEFRENGGSVVLVSHSMHNVKLATDTAIWMDKGQIRQWGPSVEVVTAYEQHMLAKGDRTGRVILSDDSVSIVRFSVPARFKSGEGLVIDVQLQFARPVKRPIFNLHLHADTDDTLVLSHHSDLEGEQWTQLHGRVDLTITTGPLNLRRGAYRISFTVSEGTQLNYLLYLYKRYAVEVVNDRSTFGAVDGSVRFLIDRADAM